MGKIPKRREKKFYYRRASWGSESKMKALANLIEDAHTNYKTAGERTFKAQGGGEFQCARWKKDTNSDILIHLALYYPGQPTSTISKSKDESSSNVEIHSAPESKEFLEGDIFALIRNNHIVLCCSAVREKYLDLYLRKILNKNKIDTSKFYVDKVAKASKIKLIKDEGVKEIVLKTSLYKATIDEFEEDRVQNVMGQVRSQIERIFAKDPELKEIRENENINLQISLKYNGKEAMRNKKDPEFGIIGKKRLVEASQLLISDTDDDGFVIITGSGNEISSDDIRVAETFYVATLGKSLDYIDAWGKLSEYANQLEASGVFSQ
jgi:hypothetical protein